MKNQNLFISFIVILIISLSLSSCQVLQNVEFTPTLGGKSTTNLKTDSFFEGVVEDLSSWTPDNSEDAVMETAIKTFEEKLRKTDSAFQINFDLSEENYYGTFRFKGLEPLLSEMVEGLPQEIIKAERGRSGKLEIRLNMDNYETLTKIIPFLADPDFEVYGPVYNHGMEEEDYLDMISFILGEEGPDSIRNSFIDLTFKLPSKVKTNNGTLIDPYTVNFRIPLIKILLLNEEIYFYATW